MKITAFFLITILHFSYSQKGNLYTTESSKLPENKIWSICVDKNKNKFVGTANFGISKFDSLNFKIYDKSNSIIKGQYISPIFNDSKNNIWAFSSNPNKLFKYTNEYWQEIKNPLIEGSIVDICEDKNNNLYFCFLDKVLVYNGISWEKITTPNIKYNYRCISVGNSKEIALGHNDGLLLRRSGKWTNLTIKNSELQSYVTSLFYDDSNKLYIGYGGSKNGGVSIYSKRRWIHYNTENSNLSDNLVRDIEIDPEGNLWLATNHGLNKLEDGKITPYFFRKTACSITDIAIEGRVIWIATHFGLIRFVDG